MYDAGLSTYKSIPAEFTIDQAMLKPGCLPMQTVSVVGIARMACS